jgi:hypothetical protein
VPGERYKIDAGHVVHETLDGEVILIHLESGNYYSLRGAGTDVWGLLERWTTPDDIVLALQARYSPEPGMAASVHGLLTELAAERLVEHGAGAADAPANGGALSPEPGSTPFAPPVLEKYTDMRDYLLVDPLHDVDERGWPSQSRDSE